MSIGNTPLGRIEVEEPTSIFSHVLVKILRSPAGSQIYSSLSAIGVEEIEVLLCLNFDDIDQLEYCVPGSNKASPILKANRICLKSFLLWSRKLFSENKNIALSDRQWQCYTHVDFLNFCQDISRSGTTVSSIVRGTPDEFHEVGHSYTAFSYILIEILQSSMDSQIGLSLSARGVNDIAGLLCLSYKDIDKLAYCPPGSTKASPIQKAFRIRLKSFLQWSDKLLSENGNIALSDKQWKNHTRDDFKNFCRIPNCTPVPSRVLGMSDEYHPKCTKNSTVNFKLDRTVYLLPLEKRTDENRERHFSLENAANKVEPLRSATPIGMFSSPTSSKRYNTSFVSNATQLGDTRDATDSRSITVVGSREATDTFHQGPTESHANIRGWPLVLVLTMTSTKNPETEKLF
jgi:hypothetical protein